MILDATAGNRTMWQTKISDKIIYIDMERKLQTKPTLFADNMATPFRDATFTSIFYDPPHDFGAKPFDHEMRPLAVNREYIKHHPFSTTYYGWDKYATKMDLIKHLWQAQHEFYRILTHDGLLWVKWCEIALPINKLLSIFADWSLLLEIKVRSPTQTWGSKQTWWLCLCKKSMESRQTTLL
jgi:hypothetical protein